MEPLFRDRHDAGRALADRLVRYARQPDVLVLGLPRGGVPVAFEVAEALEAPLDVIVVRKLGVPGHEELAMGAIASGGARIVNDVIVQELGIPEAVFETVVASEERELKRREQRYRGTRPALDVAGRTVILVDDGLATGSSMRVAAEAVRQGSPGRIIVAAPVAAPVICDAFHEVVDEVVCAATPEPLLAVGLWYEDFSATSDEEVHELLAAAQARRAIGAGTHRVLPAEPGEPASDVEAIRAAATPLGGRPGDHDELLRLVGDARVVLIGEATHGTQEFYAERAAVTRRLIEERDFAAVVVEADWPDAYRVDRFVRGMGEDRDAQSALAEFSRFPQWMWRNTVVSEFVEWLRRHNDARPVGRAAAGFYGLDLYSLHASIEAVIVYLDGVDPAAADRARRRYGCFDHFGDDAQLYGYATSLGHAEPCEDEVVNQLLELQRRAAGPADDGDGSAREQLFFAEQNARLAKNAEAYYRAMFRGRTASWNLRDRHMTETVDRLSEHLSAELRRPAKLVVWAHNSHVGDARATEMTRSGELNLGQLIRERFGDAAFIVGMSTYAGTVMAASEWGGAAERKRVRPAIPDSVEALFHKAAIPAFLLPLSDASPATDRLGAPRLERAIGVVYRPETERVSHYLEARLADQFDAVIHIDETRAITPLDDSPGSTIDEPPETFPSGL